jgi:hypothetical protein
MHSIFSKPAKLPFQPWFLLLLAAYAVLELSFNHRLLELAAGMGTGVDASRVQAIERWARVVSGLGLALLLMRWLAGWISSRVWLLVVSVGAGVWLMWHLQKNLVDAIVSRASDQDLHMSVQAQLSTAEALKGRLELAGRPVLQGPVPPELRSVMGALWSSSVLGLTPQDLEPTSGAAQLARHAVPLAPTQQQLRDAYRKAVMLPVALGLSLGFGLLNLCQLFAGVGVRVLRRWSRGQVRAERWLLPVLVVLCASASWWPANAWVDSPGYSQVARPALWQNKPFLAPFVEWSLRAEPAWSDPVAWVHRALLADFDFREPELLPPNP